MNLGQLRTLCLSWLDDPSATYFTPAQVNVWLNNAQRECQKQLIQAGQQWYTTFVSTTLVLNQDTYAVPTDFLKVNKMQVLLSGVTPNQNRTLINPVTLVQIDQVSMTTGTPAAYAMRKNSFVLRPIPDQALTLYMDYTYRVSEMTTDSSLPDVPNQYHEYLAVLATLDGLFKDQREPQAMMAKKDYYLGLMKQDAAERRIDAAREVVVTDSWDIGVLF